MGSDHTADLWTTYFGQCPKPRARRRKSAMSQASKPSPGFQGQNATQSEWLDWKQFNVLGLWWELIGFRVMDARTCRPSSGHAVMWETGPLVQHHNLRYSCRSNICSFGRPAHFSMCMGCPETCFFLALNKSEYCFSCLGVIALCGYGAKWEVRFIVYSLQNRYMIHGKVCIVLPRLLPHYV